MNDPWYWVGDVAPEPIATESKVRWTGVVAMVAGLEQVILGTDGVAGSGVIQDREVSDPTPAISSGERS